MLSKKMNYRIGLILSAVIAVAVVGYVIASKPAPTIVSRQIATTNAIATDKPKNGSSPHIETTISHLPESSEVTRVQPKTTQLLSPEAAIMNASNLATAIQQARLKYGESNNVLYAENFAAMACSRDPDPNGTISAHTSDSLRAWAISKWLQQCKGMDTLPHTDGHIDFSSPAKIAKDQGIQAGIHAAMQVIQTSNEIPELYEAGQVLIENGQFPTASIAGLDPNLGAPDLIKSWLFAAELWNCNQNGGCGPDNFRTVDYCSVAGCPPDSNLLSALNASLSVRDMQAVSALYQWIANNR